MLETYLTSYERSGEWNHCITYGTFMIQMFQYIQILVEVSNSILQIFRSGNCNFFDKFQVISLVSVEICSRRNQELNLDEIRGDNLDGVYCQLKNIVDYSNFMNFRKPKLLMTRDYISMYMILMKVRESTCLKIAIDRQIAGLQSSGLVEHWRKSYTKTVKDTEDKNPINLKLDQFIGIIEICAALYALSLLMFLIELMSSKCKIIRIFMDILTFK